ncbi:splicing factor Cactin-like isoform X1 [Clytia hemisphaerica]|uniref:Splicing factor cactin central domain-containing protein n=1 Tax=Clytia hemisphaerica TaxID=252671 RepID=A0A7M6DMK0_9CNID
MGKHKSRDRSRSRSPHSSSSGKHQHSKKSKKKYSRKDSSSDSSDQESGNRMSFEEELQKIKEEKRREKELLKSTETPEQRRQRRQAKKEEKEKKFNRLKGVNDLGYTNTDNPFGDTNLTDNFVWNKKHQQEGTKNIAQKQRHKQEELRDELEKVKRRRQEREREKAARDEEMTLMQREKEAAMFSNWEKQEDTFHLQQARLRSSIRITNGRAKPIDLLAVYINPEEENLEIQMHEPYAALVGLSIDDLEDLLADITVYLEIDQEKNIDFWEDITIIVKDELAKLKKMRGEVSNRRDVINSSVQTDVNTIFKGKTYSQLIALQKQIRAKIKAGGSIDVGYWETLLQQLKAIMAKTRLKERHQKMLKGKLEEMKMESTVDDDAELPSTKRYKARLGRLDEEDNNDEPSGGELKETNKESDNEAGPSSAVEKNQEEGGRGRKS